MKQRNPILLVAIVALVLIGIIAYLKVKKPAAPVIQESHLPAGPATNQAVPPQSPVTNAVVANPDTNVVYQIRADQVLATVNGVQIKLADVAPLSTTNGDAVMPLDAVSYNYLLDRAIVRELMMQTAKAQGVNLTEGQQEQLAKLQAQREQPEPGLLTKLNVNAADIELQIRDTQAFMLQTLLMAQQGRSPDVTPDKVDDYLKAHASQFGDPPIDPQELKEWKANVDVTIRHQLARETRAEYIAQLKAYLDYLESRADITRPPPQPVSAGKSTF